MMPVDLEAAPRRRPAGPVMWTLRRTAQTCAVHTALYHCGLQGMIARGSQMGWLEFIASIVRSIAWPLVVLALLYILRQQLGGLAERLTEFSFPGGKAKFKDELAKGRRAAQKLPKQKVEQPPEQREEEDRLVRIAAEAPEGAVILAYIDLEKKLRELALKLGHSSRIVNHMGVIKDLEERGAMAKEGVQLFSNLREARNSAAHGVGPRLTTEDALEYIEQAGILETVLDAALKKL
jgi:hypothetical protein